MKLSYAQVVFARYVPDTILLIQDLKGRRYHVDHLEEFNLDGQKAMCLVMREGHLGRQSKPKSKPKQTSLPYEKLKPLFEWTRLKSPRTGSLKTTWTPTDMKDALSCEGTFLWTLPMDIERLLVAFRRRTQAGREALCRRYLNERQAAVRKRPAKTTSRR